MSEVELKLVSTRVPVALWNRVKAYRKNYGLRANVIVAEALTKYCDALDRFLAAQRQGKVK